MELLSRYSLDPQGHGVILGCFYLSLGAIISVYIIHILSFDKEMKKAATTHKVNLNMFTPYVISYLILAYFTAGVGFVVQATFFPDIMNSLEGLEGYGSLGWLIVGLAGIPSAIIWMILAHKYGSVNIIILVSSITSSRYTYYLLYQMIST